MLAPTPRQDLAASPMARQPTKDKRGHVLHLCCCAADAGQVAIFDATNTTHERRQLLVSRVARAALLARVHTAV
jgi:hypothetical protein